MDGASGYIKSSPLLVSQPFFYFRCSHISWRRWRERIWAPVSSGWVRGRTSLPAHGYWMEGEGESSVQAVQSHICTRWTCLLGGWTSGFGATHSMAVLQVFQAKMLTSEEGGLDADSLRDLRRQTWLYAPPKPSAFDVQPDSFRAPPLAHDNGDERGGQSSLPWRSGFVRQPVWTSCGGLCGTLHGGSEVVSSDATLPPYAHQLFCCFQLP